MLTRYQHVLDEMKVMVADKVGDALFSDPAPGAEVGPRGCVVSLADFKARKSS